MAELFGCIAVMYAVLAMRTQIVPGTFGRSIEDLYLPA
jgi:hypothetical protein